MSNKPKIIFMIGMHRCGTSLLSSCLVQNGFSIGITKNQDKNWQNPNGYCENDAFTKMHEKLLYYNNCSWNTITKERMNYTQHHIQQYRKLLKTEFINELILIKDPRLTFFVDFLKEVCSEDYEYYFLFCSRYKNECCTSLCKAQNISQETASKLYDITHDKYTDEYLKISHNEIINNNNLILSKISNYCKINLNINTETLVDMKLYRNRKS